MNERQDYQAYLKKEQAQRDLDAAFMDADLRDGLATLLRRIAEQVEKPDATVWKETPARWLKALMEMTQGYRVDTKELLKTFENEKYNGVIVVDVPFWSLCEHHLLPFHGRAWVGYLTGEDCRIVGLSKIARLVTAHAQRLQVQERLTSDIAHDIKQGLDARGVAVRIESVHTCMCARGINKEGSMRTQTLLGAFRNEPETRAEFDSLIRKADK